jgi:hypothetical protein
VRELIRVDGALDGGARREERRPFSQVIRPIYSSSPVGQEESLIPPGEVDSKRLWEVVFGVTTSSYHPGCSSACSSVGLAFQIAYKICEGRSID